MEETFLISQKNKHIKIYENIRKIAVGQGDDYTNGFILDYPHFKENYMLIAVNLSNQQALDADQIKIARNREQVGNKTMFFIFEEVKEAFLYLLHGIVRFL